MTPETNTVEDTMKIDTNKDIFSGIEDKSTSVQPIVTNTNRYRHLYEQLNSTAKTIYDKLYENRENLKRVFLLIDYRHKPTEDDVLMYNYLKYYNLNITIVATKYDKVTKNNRIKQDKLIKDTLKLSDEEVFVPFSTVTKKGREDILKIIESY